MKKNWSLKTRAENGKPYLMNCSQDRPKDYIYYWMFGNGFMPSRQDVVCGLWMWTKTLLSCLFGTNAIPNWRLIFRKRQMLICLLLFAIEGLVWVLINPYIVVVIVFKMYGVPSLESVNMVNYRKPSFYKRLGKGNNWFFWEDHCLWTTYIKSIFTLNVGIRYELSIIDNAKKKYLLMKNHYRHTHKLLSIGSIRNRA
jgi:hypothetical protein